MPPLIVAALGGEAALGVITVSATASISVASTLANVIFTAALVGAEYALASTQKQKSSPFQQTVQQALTARFHVEGREKVGGFKFFDEAYGVNYGVGIVLNCEPIDGIEAVYQDDRLLSLVSTSGGLTQYLNNFTSDGQVEVIEASPGGYLSALLTTYSFGPIWDGTHLGKDLTILYARAFTTKDKKRLSSYFPNGFPRYYAILRGAPRYDPRDGAQSPTNPATWVWTQNAALLAAGYAINPAGLALDPSWVNWTTVAAAASRCDVSTSGYAGASPFARASTTWTEDEEPRNVLGRLLAVADMTHYEDQNGDFCLRVAEWVDEAVVFTDQDISVAIDDPWQAGVSRVNVVRAKWTDPANNYGQVEASSAIDTASVAAWGEATQDLDLSACPNGDQAYRMAQRVLKRLQQGRLQLTVGPRGLLAIGQRVVRVTSAALGIDAVYDILSMGGAGTLDAWRLDLREVTTDIYANEIAPVDPFHVAPQLAAFIVPDAVVDAIDEIAYGPGRSIQVSALDPSDTTLFLIGQYRATGATDWFDLFSIGALICESGPVAGGAYDVQIKFRNGVGQDSVNWTAASLTVTGEPAPMDPVSITATGGSGTASGSVLTPNDPNFAATQIWRAVTGTGFGAAVTTGAPIYGAPNATLAWSDTHAAGTFDYFATSLNAVGATGSGHAGPATATIT